MSSFDPYQSWLGIPRQEQPPHHYRLLGIAPLEANPAIIQQAAERQTKTLQMQAVGPYVALAQQICGEVAAARHCLLTPAAKSTYDAQLSQRMAKAAATPATTPARPLPVAAPLPIAVARPSPVTAPARPRPIPAHMPQTAPREEQPAAPAIDAGNGAKPTLAKPGGSSARRPASSGKATAGRSALELAKIICGGIAGLAIAVLILNYFVGIDPLGWSVSARKDDGKPKKVAVVKPQPYVQVFPNNPSPSREVRDPSIPMSVGPNNFPPPSTNPPDRNPFNNGFVPPQPKNPPSAPPEEGPPEEEPRSLADLTKTGKKTPGPPAKKSPLPLAAEQASKLATIKDIYKTEFAAVRPGGANPEFVSFLLSTADKVEGDPVARYVLYMEAFRQACAGNDFVSAADSLDNLEEDFESEPFAPRYELLTKMAPGAKANEERLILTRGALQLFDNALALGKIEEADKLARIADAHTKFIVDKELRAKAVAALQTTSERTKDLGAVAAAREKLAQSPDDPAANLAVGRYHCLIEMNWAAGLPHLAKGDDDGLKSAATLDLAGPRADITAGKIGDAWYDLAKGGKGQNFYARADYWYLKGMEVESGLALVRLKKRHEEIAELKLPSQVANQPQEQLEWPSARDLVSGRSGDLPSTDLLALVNPLSARPVQGWTRNEGSWRSPAAAQDAYSFFESSFSAPRREYSMQVRVSRAVDSDTKGRTAGAIMLGLTQKGRRFALVIDEVSSSGQRRAYLTMGTAGEMQNSSVVIYPQIKVRSDDIVCNVASDQITVLINGTQLLQYSGDMSVLALPPNAKYPPSKPFFYGQHCGVNAIDRWTVGPLVEKNGVAPGFPPSDIPGSPKVKKGVKKPGAPN